MNLIIHQDKIHPQAQNMLELKSKPLTVDSKLADLPSYDSSVDSLATGNEIAKLFDENSNLPGVLVFHEEKLFGVVSRQKFLENLGKPFGVDIFMKRPIYTMIQHIKAELDILREDVSIPEASQAALNRPPHLVYEPVIIAFDDGSYRILDLHVLLLGQSHVLRNINDIIARQKEIEEALRLASAELSTTFNIQRIIEVLLKNIAKFIEFSSAHVFMYEDGNFWLRGSCGETKIEKPDPFSYHSQNDYFLKMLHMHSPVIIPNVHQNGSGQTWWFNKKIRSWVGVPLIQGTRIFGVLTLESRQLSAYSNEQIEIVQTFIHQVSSTLQNAYLYQAEKKRAKELSSLSRAASSLVSTLDPQELLKQILKSAIMAVDSAENGVLYVWDSVRSEYYVGALFGVEDWSNESPVQNGEKELIDRVSDNKKPLIVRYSNHSPISLLENEIWQPAEEGHEYAQLLIPMVHEKKILGILSLNTRTQKIFEAVDTSILEVFSTTASAAIRNSQLHAELQHLAIKDPLTGLLNRRGFYRQAKREVSRAKRYDHSLSLIMIDIDYFKQVNDDYGHDIGDQVIQSLGKQCMNVIRSTDLSCRFGGEEFVILLPETKPDIAWEVAERLRREIANMTTNTGKGIVSVTISIGITFLENCTNQDDPRIALERMLSQADQALYSSKIKGRNQITVWDFNLTSKNVNTPSTDSYEYFMLAETLHQREAELKWVENSRKITEEHLASILQNASEAIISVNELDRIMVFNRSAENMFGYKSEEVLGKSIRLIFTEEKDLVNWDMHLNHPQETEFTVSERKVYSIKCKDGLSLPVEASHSGFNINGQTIYTIILTDITKRQHAEERVKKYNLELSNAYDETIAGLAAALELRDIETLGHSRRVVEMTLDLARVMQVDEESLVHIRRGALLHDIGKLSVPDDILFKPDKLTEVEWGVMKQHPTIAYELLEGIQFLKPALDIPHYHHERWDGKGYPNGLKGEAIPLFARIFSVVDVWDALRSVRPYRAAWSFDKCRIHILEESGSHFDPKVISAFLELLDENKV